MKLFVLLFSGLLIVLFSNKAIAACTLPAGNATAMVLSTVQTATGRAGYAPAASVDLLKGVILYDQSDNTLKICNGTSFVPISSVSPVSPGPIVYACPISNTGGSLCASTCNGQIQLGSTCSNRFERNNGDCPISGGSAVNCPAAGRLIQ